MTPVVDTFLVALAAMKRTAARQRALQAVGLSCAAITICSPALAHVGAGAHVSFADGLAHPFSGLDHMLAAFAVGLWAALSDARRPWLLPAIFVVAMSVAAVAGANGLYLPSTDSWIAGSVVALGLLAALAVRAPTLIGASLVALFAVMHGYAHGAEGGAAPSYLAGLVGATALLHVAGLAFGRLSLAVDRPRLARGAGAAVALAGIVLLAS